MAIDFPRGAPEGADAPGIPSDAPVPAPGSRGWMSGNLRNMIALSLTGVVVYLALSGNHDAMVAVVTSYTVLMGAIWGERAALKQPGKDA